MSSTCQVQVATAIEQFETVANWSSGLADQWGGDPLSEEPQKLQTLLEFCEYFDKNPDELVAYCYLRKRDSGKAFVSIKRRKSIALGLREFQSSRRVEGLAARRLTADVLSFLIHNSIQMHSGMV